jgi:RHS repeat-associated protein
MRGRFSWLAGSPRRRVAVAVLTLAAVGLVSFNGAPNPAQAQDVIVFPKADGAAEASSTTLPTSSVLDLPTPAAVSRPVQVALPEPPPMRTVPGFEEPLVATGDLIAGEQIDLDAAIAAFQIAPAADGDFADSAKAFTDFLTKHPASPWKAAIQTNLGIGYYRAGYFSRALAAWNQAWQSGRNATSIQATALVDRAVGELARMHARVGHATELEQLFADVGTRPVSGPATETMTGAHEGLASFQRDPGTSYLCGPQALKNVLITLKASPEQIKVADDARSGPHGFSLDQVAALAAQAKLPYKLIYRTPGQPIPVPAVINWNVHHYAAVIGTLNGAYDVMDPTFGGARMVITAKAIDAESSGYFLVPAAVAAANPNSGWRSVDPASAEAKAVYGMGAPGWEQPHNTQPSNKKTGCPEKSPNASVGSVAPESKGMCAYNIHAALVSLNLVDGPVGYAPPKGSPVFVNITYNQREAFQPAVFSNFNVSPKWTLNWLTYISDNPQNPGIQPIRHISGGGAAEFTYDYGLPPLNGVNEVISGAYFKLMSYTPVRYERQLPDGSKEVYATSDGVTSGGYNARRIFLTQVIDPAGNIATLNYDATFRLTSVTDAAGRNTTFSYGLTSYPLLVTQITDPFGRHADLTYDASLRLATITDVVGITSTFGYDANGLVNVLTTPYGTSNFVFGQTSTASTDYKWLEATDPLGASERVEYWNVQPTGGTNLPYNDPVAQVPTGLNTSNAFLYHRTTYHWDKHMLPLARPGGVGTAIDYLKSTRSKWVFAYNGFAGAYPMTTMLPLESRVWFNYQGQSDPNYAGKLPMPNATARVLDDGTTQLTKATYNALGNPLTRTDPKGRVTQFTYAANNVDLLTVQQLTTAPSTYTTLATYSNYNSQHLPQTYTDAAGQIWSTAYNAAGQVTYTTNPLNETRFWEYDSVGRINRVTVPTVIAFASVVYGTTNTGVATASSYTYDAYDRVRTATDAGGYVLTYDYDAFDRVTKITYPDATHDDRDYTFQSGTYVGTASLDLRKSTDRLGRVTTYAYDANRRLTSVTEPLTVSTTRTTSYSYYENNALKDQTDGNGNVTHYAIDLESRPVSKTYAYGTAAAKTETYAYETTTSRLKSVTDALGQVKTMTYGLDDRPTAITYTASVNATPNVSVTWDTYFPRPISMVDGTGTTSFTYVPVGTACAPPTTTTNCGALQLASVDNASFSNDTIANTYDALGRVSSRAISGGNEGATYDTLGRLATHTNTLGTFTYGYLGNTGSATSRSVTVGSVTTSSAWGYDTNTNDRRLTSITNSGVTRNYALSYLIPGGGGASSPYDIQGITDTAAGTHPWLTQTHTFGYDYADRLLTANQTTPGNNAYAYDKLDNTTTATIPGSGTVNPTYNANNQIATWGANTYAMDANGNTLSGDGTKTYKWDAENRLIEIDYVGGTDKTVFGYDGMSHRITQAETVSGTTTTTRYLWCGPNICQSRTGADVVTARYHPEGEYIVTGTMKYVYMPDQLGSVRDVIDATTGTRVAAIDYGPYGSRTRTSGSVTPGYQYAGLFYHAKSGLMLATYRALDGTAGRWLNRDPIREAGGINLYAYAGGNSVNYADPSGLYVWPTSPWDKVVIIARGALLLEFIVSSVFWYDIYMVAQGPQYFPTSPDSQAQRRSNNDPNQNQNGKPSGAPGCPNQDIPRGPHGERIPDPDAGGPHTRIGQKDGSKGRYPVGSEFDENGNWVGDIHHTTHGRSDHTNPHYHRAIPNPTGGTPGFGPPEAM